MLSFRMQLVEKVVFVLGGVLGDDRLGHPESFLLRCLLFHQLVLVIVLNLLEEWVIEKIIGFVSLNGRVLGLSLVVIL